MSHPSEDEEDYMSDAFLLKCEDKRPGLIFSSKTAKQIERERKQKESNERNKVKPKKVLEHEKRTEGLSTALSANNKGFSLLQKMGYKPGMSLGKKGTGRAEPVPIEIKADRGGLGKAAEAKRKAEEMQAMRARMAVKRQRTEVKQKESFVQHMSSRFASKTVGKDLNTSQTACHHLDTESGYTRPVERFHWPDNWWSLEEKPEGGEEEEEGEEHLQEEEGEEDEDEGQSLTDEEKLQALTFYLRTTYHYCIWCGTKYNDSEDMEANCPGDSAEAHD
ncbi:G patch domain-containing protein 11-like [Babylonia areolata]|uniref:G patch domain-containing protein 11-like n=1 Tax=Babylonia areolata TaxID=304850 RepID=UPI003FD1F120